MARIYTAIKHSLSCCTDCVLFPASAGYASFTAIPRKITDELIAVIRDEEKICKYLDLPIQHASDNILKRMGRRTSRADLEAVIEKLRREIPGIALRTTLITGFPGETQAEHEELMTL